MAENYDPNDPESVRRYVEEQTKVQSKLTADTNRFGRAMNTAFSGAGTAALSFASAVGSAEKGFSKYNSVVRDITNTIGELTSEFGIFGKSIGAAAKATGIMIEQVFAQTDRMSKGFDEIADIGAQAHFTAGALRGLSEAAGGSTFQMQAVGKAAKTAGSAFINVGDSVGTGMQKFGDIVTKNMTGFRKLGFTFEEVFEYTGKYLQQANALGVNLNRPVADLRKSSEAYMKNLVILADLTGADIKQQQQAIDLAASQENFRMKGLLLEKQLQEAKLRGDTANEAKIQKQIDGMLALSQGIARFDKDTQIAMLQSFASGGKVMSEQAAKLLIGGFDINKFGRAFDEGAEATTIVAQMLDDNAQAIKTTTERYGYAIASLNSAGQELAKTTGTSVERMTLASERNVFGQQKSAQKSLEAAEAGVEAQMGTRDALMAGVANMEQMERNVQRKIDEVVDKFNPFNSSMEDAIKSFKILAAAAFAATYAMGIMTSAQARRNPFSNENDRYGRRTIPGTGGIVGPGSAASAPWVRVANLMDICNCVGGGAAMPLGSQGMNKAQQKQYRRMRAQGVSEAQARGRILGAGGVGAGSLPGTGGIVAPVPVAPSVDAQPSRMARIGAAVKDRAGHMMTVGGHAGAAMIGGYALSEGANLAQSLGLVGEQGASGMKVAGGIASSAAQYAMLGSIFGPIGTGIGAVAGGLMGVVENFDSIKGFFSDSNEAAEKSIEATEAATVASEALAESRNRTEEFLREAIAANTEATRQNTTVTTTAGGAPTTGGEAGVEGEKPRMSVEDVEKGFANRQAEMAAEFMAKHQAVFQGWNTNDTKELERLEATAKSIKEKYTVERDAIVNTMYGAHVIKERVIEDEAAKKSLDELTAKINHMKEMRTKRSQTLAALEAEYRKNTADLEEQRRTLQITRENVAVINEATDERLKALAELLNGPMLAGTGAGSTTPGAPMPQGGKGNYTAEDLARQGLKTRGYGDVQEPGAVLNNRLIDLSKNIQENVPGFKYFSGFNDKWHKTANPNSRHTRGEAVDFTLNYHPDRQQGADLVKQLKAMGFSYAQDEYNNPSSHATGKHMHAQLEEGGIVDGPKSGFPVEMHGREIVTPLEPNSILEQLGKTMGNFTNIKDDRSQEQIFEKLSNTLFSNMDSSLKSFTEKYTAPEFTTEMVKQVSMSEKVLEKFDNITQTKEDKTTIDIESVNKEIADRVENAMRNLSEENSKAAGEYILRLERVIDILESSHSTQEKLLRSSRT